MSNYRPDKDAVNLNGTDGPLHRINNPFLNSGHRWHPSPPRSEIVEDLGDHEDEYSRRVSSIPLGSWDYPMPDCDSGQTLVHSNVRSPDQGTNNPTGTAAFHSQFVQDGGDSGIPSPGRTYQGRTSRIPFTTPRFDDNASSYAMPLGAENNAFPTGLKRRQTFSRDKESDLDAYDIPPHDYDAQERRGAVGGLDDDDEGDSPFRKTKYAFSSAVSRLPQSDSSSSLNSEQGMDPEDPRVTGRTPHNLDEIALEKEMLQNMDYRSRRKYIQRIKIEFNISPIFNRQRFLLKLARGLMTFGAPSHRIESQLTAAARILGIQAEFIHLPGVIICSFGEQDTGTSETHFVRSTGRLNLGALHKLHVVYRSVLHDELSAKDACDEIDILLGQGPIYSTVLRCIFAFWLAVLICPLAFGGSFVDMWFSGLSGFVLAFLQIYVASKSALYANVFEITASIIVSFAARGLSAIRSQIFCYTAISSSGIIGILPGYLILTSSLELASKNIVNGSVKMVYALIYTLFLGFGLQIGNDFYLLLDPPYRRQLEGLKNHLSSSVSVIGTWSADNGTDSNSQVPLSGTFTFSHTMTPIQLNIIDGCYRPAHFPWYLQPFPLWTSFIIVPLFSIISSLANLQPFNKQLPIMVVISCCSYAANKVANHYIFNRSDVVSAIGAFTVGLLGNIYSRKMGGTAFTAMVTGVLFLVPSGLSSAGGITANGNGIDIGGAMIAVTIGITVGLFMSQSIVYTFGARKNAAVFSF